ncbi:MAG: hypothetical protein JSR37_06345 [Verrucomicrobia bacterium]|nr:hypothetical protein [Verrucomicrobiota bacterium]MBS0636392.1 hypothetical protein [Verrucomicrobiota bacterium]
MANSARTSILLLVLSLFFACISGKPITFIAGPMVMLLYNASLGVCLWAALISGLFLDAVEMSPKFGFLALSYLLACRLVYSFRLYFFKDSYITLPAMTFLFSFFAGCIELLVALFFDITVPTSGWEWLFVVPMVDLFFVLALFSLPTFIWHQYCVRVKRRRYSDDS